MTVVLFVGGPSGTGKSTISVLLKQALVENGHSCEFLEGDDYHSSKNIDKMRNNIPLNDEDRFPWLQKLIGLANSQNDKEYLIISCSMLKKDYRSLILNGVENPCTLVILSNTFENVLQQMKQRKGHFFKEDMLKSQYDCFELPENEHNVLVVQTIEKSPSEIVKEIMSKI